MIERKRKKDFGDTTGIDRLVRVFLRTGLCKPMLYTVQSLYRKRLFSVHSIVTKVITEHGLKQVRP